MEQIHFDLGASIQRVLEDIILKIAKHIHKKTGMKNLCYGGGVALNGVANYRLLQEGPFTNLFIPPSPGDAGSAVGCAQYAYYVHHNNPTKNTEQELPQKICENVLSDDDLNELYIKYNITEKLENLSSAKKPPKTAKIKKSPPKTAKVRQKYEDDIEDEDLIECKYCFKVFTRKDSLLKQRGGDVSIPN